jgi:protein-S-isoprenylcysteine O-methyltransferase Ste14
MIGTCTAPAQLPILHFIRSGQISALGVTNMWDLLPMGAIFCAGLGVLLWAWVTIGTPGVGFVDEFTPSPKALMAGGVYKYIRHPIALGGVTFPAAFAIHGGLSLDLALINISMLIPYGMVEDRRLEKVFGHTNDTYVSTVRRFVPVIHLPRATD